MIRDYVGVINEVASTLEPEPEDITERQEKFEGLIDRFEATEDPIRHGMAAVMLSFLAGLFVGEEEYEAIRDDLDMERWFRLPKGHERRIHGHCHAGIRLVLEGATLALVLDAHATHPGPLLFLGVPEIHAGMRRHDPVLHGASDPRREVPDDPAGRGDEGLW